MNNKKLLWGLLILIGLVDAVLNIWVFLLNQQTLPLLQAAVGIMVMILGIVRFRGEPGKGS